MTPLLGDAFFTSAMSPGLPVAAAAARMAPMKSRAGAAALAALALVMSRGRGTFSRQRATSTALCLGARRGERWEQGQAASELSWIGHFFCI